VNQFTGVPEHFPGAGEIPPRLFKLRSLRGQGAEFARQLIVEGKLWFASPLTFNDPFDTLPNISLGGTEREKQVYYRRLVRTYLSEGSRAQRLRQARELQHVHHHANQELMFKAARETAEDLAVCSFATSADSVLLWSHYAAEHTGVCVEIDTSSDFFAGSLPLPVSYSAVRPTYHAVKEDRGTDLLEKLLTKADFWAYEKEWRMVEKHPGIRHLPEGAIRGVYLGCRISEEDKTTVLNWVSQDSEPAPVFQGSPAADTFEIRYERVS
jgi:hypothetical protein